MLIQGTSRMQITMQSMDDIVSLTGVIKQLFYNLKGTGPDSYRDLKITNKWCGFVLGYCCVLMIPNGWTG